MNSILKSRLSCLLLLSVAVLLSQAAGSAQNSPVEKYGENSGPPTSNGFFFADGMYVEAPYVVKRVGLAIYINGHRVERGHEPFDWRVYQDPGPAPDNVTPWDERKSGTDWSETYWPRKWRYLNTVTDPAKAKAQMFESLSKISGVTNLSWGKKKDDLIVTDSSGTERTISLALRQPLPIQLPTTRGASQYLPSLEPIPTKDEMIEEIEKVRLQYENDLKANTARFVVLEGSGQQLLGEAVAIPAIAVILSSKSPEDRIAALKKLGVNVAGSWGERFENLQVGNREELSARWLRIKEEWTKKRQDAKLKGEMSRLHIDGFAREVVGKADLVTQGGKAASSPHQTSESQKPPETPRPQTPAPDTASGISSRVVVLILCSALGIVVVGSLLTIALRRRHSR